MLNKKKVNLKDFASNEFKEMLRWFGGFGGSGSERNPPNINLIYTDLISNTFYVLIYGIDSVVAYCKS